MQCNVGKADRSIRFIVGLIVIAMGFYFQSWWGALGLIPLLTAIFRWCPPYALLGINTGKK